MPNGRALYDSIRDCLDWSCLHTRTAYDGIIKILLQIKRPLFYSSIGSW